MRRRPGGKDVYKRQGVPIVGAGETLGNLYLADKINAPSFSEGDEELIRLLAAHAAVAIQNARLYAQLELSLIHI